MNKVIAAAMMMLAAGVTASAQSPVERGKYLVTTVMACGNCHSPRGPQGFIPGKDLSGGIKFDEPPFTVTASNITPDPKTGIGAWSDADLKKALVDGTRPDGVPLAPIMPYAFYKVITPADLDAIVAYLRSIPAVESETPTPIYKMTVHAPDVPNASKPMNPADFSDKVKYGSYLATIAHCMECHTPRPKGQHDFSQMGKGGNEFPGPWGKSVSPNITSHVKAGIGSWSDDEIKRAITKGVSKDGRQLKPPMGYGFYDQMTAADLDALVAWLRTVPPLE